MDTRSQHLLFDAVCESPLTAMDVEQIKGVIEKNLTVVQKIEHQFAPQGETIVFILSESHFTLHTYPENNYVSMDVYVCNMDIDLNRIVDEIAGKVAFSKMDKKILARGKIGTDVSSMELKLIYFVTTVVACASILYEFLLAQSLSTTMGNTALRYNLTIGLYIASMGIGALLYKRLLSRRHFVEFVKIEIMLSVIGCVSPILVLFNDYFFNHVARILQVSFFSTIIQAPLFTANHVLILIIGFLSGLELPLLIDMGKLFDRKKGNFVLAYDYLGTLLGAVLFPIVILPSLHIFTIGYVVSFLNVLVALFVMLKMKVEHRAYRSTLFALLVLWVMLIFNAEIINEWLVQIFYFGN